MRENDPTFVGVSGVIYYKYCKTQSSVLRILEITYIWIYRKIELNFYSESL